MRILIIGAGGHAQVIADVIRTAPRVPAGPQLVGYLDDRKSLHGTVLVGAPVLGPVSMLSSVAHDAAIVAIGDNTVRATMVRRLLQSGTRLTSAIHGNAVVSPDAVIGQGSMLCAGVIVNTGTRIGRSVILNTGCTVDHHTVVGDFVHIAPGVHMGGEVTVGEGALVGIGAVVLPRIQIGTRAIVGAGAVVTRDVPDGVTVVGNPARPLARAAIRQSA